ncbi:hypothetical protein ACEYW6_32545 [Nostoc sp. UIC 10607]|uniref:hypothetical protein n=1 Tax=Nostoc sp. UIC 10607 TaxID=3045935 RepID=UPI00399FFAC1
MENQETSKVPEIKVESDSCSQTDTDAEVKSEASTDQNVEIEHRKRKKALTKKVSRIIVESDRSPGTDRDV